MMEDAVWDSFLASISQHLESCFDFNRPQLTFKNDKWHWSYELKFMLIATYSKSIDNNYRTCQVWISLVVFIKFLTVLPFIWL